MTSVDKTIGDDDQIIRTRSGVRVLTQPRPGVTVWVMVVQTSDGPSPISLEIT